jgi:cell wall-associated NlpC family hydrolase
MQTSRPAGAIDRLAAAASQNDHAQPYRFVTTDPGGLAAA